MSFVAGFTAGLMVGKKKFGGSGSSGDELWTPPADWLEVPEPGPWEANFLVEINENNLTLKINFGNPENADQGFGNIIINWGDGTIDEISGLTYAEGGGYEVDENGKPIGIPWGALEHTYNSSGQFVIKATTDKWSSLLHNIYSNALLIAKLGENICLESNNSRGLGSFKNCQKLKWAEIKGNCKLSTNCFASCYSLKRIDFSNKISKIPNQCFSFCYGFNFRNIDFSEVTEIGVYGMEECCGLTKISAPQCTSVSNQAFYQCYALETATFAENCTFGTNAFQNCYNLYPRPDGSTN